MAPNCPPYPPRMAPEEPNCQHTGSPVRWGPSGSGRPVVSPSWETRRRGRFHPRSPGSGLWKTILGEWCNGSTTGSEPVSLGSNPSSPVLISALKTRHFGIRTRNAGDRREGSGLCRGYAGDRFAPLGSLLPTPRRARPRAAARAPRQTIPPLRISRGRAGDRIAEATGRGIPWPRAPRPVFDQGNGRDRRPAGDAGALPVNSSSPSPEPDGSRCRGQSTGRPFLGPDLSCRDDSGPAGIHRNGFRAPHPTRDI